jgi:hypothetical protein
VTRDRPFCTYTSVEAAIGQFLEKEAAVASLGRDMQAERAKLFEEGDKLAADSESLFAAARLNGDPSILALTAEVESKVLLVRVANWRFLATQDVKGPATFNETSIK